MRFYETSADATGLHVAVVVGRFNQLINAKLLEGCIDELGAWDRGFVFGYLFFGPDMVKSYPATEVHHGKHTHPLGLRARCFKAC